MEIVGKIRKIKAQQLVEFLLIAPFIIIFLGILTEYAYALNINMTLSEGLKTVTSSIYSQIKPTTQAQSQTQSSIVATVKTSFKQYLRANNVPVSSENNIQIGCAIEGQTAVFMASYTYIPAFTLPNIYFKFLPEKFIFFTTAAVPVAFLEGNDYSTGIDSITLDGIWSAGNFSSLMVFDGSKQGILKDDSSGGRNKILFLIPSTTAPALITKPYNLVSWSGVLKKVGTEPYTVDLSNGKLYTCSAVNCTYIKKFIDYLTDNFNNYYNVVFVHDNTMPADLTTLSTNTLWISPLGTSDLSDVGADGILKRTIGLINGNNKSRGNYDDINVTAYNSDIATSAVYYKPYYFGSMVFIYNPGSESENDIDNITAGASSIPNKNNIYYFGDKVN